MGLVHGTASMKRFSFATFLVDEGNRQAFQVCQKVADRERLEGLPITLLGDCGCGKTHLLYSIVNRVRATSSKTGLAYVTAHDFPDRVRQLIDDPSDVKRADSAVLLVDQLEQFGDLVEELEAVIRIFLDNNHYVVVASSVHPGRLQNIGPGLRVLLEAGTMVSISQHTNEIRTELLKQQVRQESEAVLVKQRDEIQQLKGLLEKVGRNGRVQDAEEVSRLKKDIEQERSAKEALNLQLEVARALATSVQHDLADAHGEIVRLRNLGDPTRDPSFAQLQEEAASLRQRLIEAQQNVRNAASRVEQDSSQRDALDAAQSEIQKLQEHIASARSEADEARAQLKSEQLKAASADREREELAAQLQAAKAESARARQETADLLDRAERSLQTIEANRARLMQAEQEQRKQVEDLRILLEQANARTSTAEELEAVKTQLLDAHARIEALSAEYEMERDHFVRSEAESKGELLRAIEAKDLALRQRDQAQHSLNDLKVNNDELLGSLEQAHDEVGQVRSQFVALQSETAAYKNELQQSRERAQSLRAEYDVSRATLARREAEMEALRQEAAGQVAAANAQAGELEGQVGRLRDAHAALQQETQRAEADVRDLERGLLAAVEGLASVVARLSTASEAEIPLRHKQQDLFDALLHPRTAVEEAFDEAPHESEQLQDSVNLDGQESHSNQTPTNGKEREPAENVALSSGNGGQVASEWDNAEEHAGQVHPATPSV
jgi:chromosome segregation ATPase